MNKKTKFKDSMAQKKIVIIGGGVSSLAAAAYLLKDGFDVTILEKNEKVGGRIRILERDGFKFDMGPSFYWMPDVFESFFNDFGKKVSDYYELLRLNPSYSVYFGTDDRLEIPADIEKTKQLFESIERGSSNALDKFIKNAEVNYDIAINDLVYKPGENLLEIVTLKTIGRLGLFIKTIKSQVASYIKNEKLRKILEFPVLFLGAKPSTTPAFYNFMNYADLVLGSWHPKGGFYELIKAMEALVIALGGKIEINQNIQSIEVDHHGMARGVNSLTHTFACDILLSGADYAHTEQLLDKSYRQYSDKYWQSKTFAPSALLYYVALDKQIDHVTHHTLFFDTDFEAHAQDIYDHHVWPRDPMFYVNFPSKTDDSFAPEGKEACFILVPVAPGLQDTEEIREKYFDIVIQRIEKLTKQSLRESIIFKQSFCIKDFEKDYNSYKGNAYGLANTLLQTHILRPKMKSKKVKNLYFTGQLTVPGPGVPPSIISGKIVSNLIKKYYEKSIR